MTDIETARLLLRPWQPGDLAEFTRLLTDPVITRYIVVHTPFSPEDVAIRMIPTVWRLNPEVVTSTAKVRTAPTTSRKILTPRLITPALLEESFERGRCQILGTKRRFNEPALQGERPRRLATAAADKATLRAASPGG